MERYVAVQEPTCTWAVFDIFDDVPVEFEGRILVGLGKAEAKLFASAVNARALGSTATPDTAEIICRWRPALIDAVPASRKLSLDDNNDAAEKSPARTWRNW